MISLLEYRALRKNVSRLIGAKKKHEYGETSNSNTYCEDEFISPIVLATLYMHYHFKKKHSLLKLLCSSFLLQVESRMDRHRIELGVRCAAASTATKHALQNTVCPGAFFLLHDLRYSGR